MADAIEEIIPDETYEQQQETLVVFSAGEQAVVDDLNQFVEGDASIAASSATGLAALAQAVGQIGVKENPVKSNCNPYSAWFHKPCQSWCVDFLSWCFDTASGHGNSNKLVPWNTSSVSALDSWLASHTAAATRVNGPAPGDICVLANGTHACIVQTTTSDGSGNFTTVDGNWQSSGPTGGMVSGRTPRNRLSGAYHFYRVIQNTGL